MVFAQIVYWGLTEILMRNNTDEVLTIAGKTQLGQVIKYKTNACYRAHIHTVGAAPVDIRCSALQDLMAFNSLAESNKTVLDNRTTCYRDPDTVELLKSKWTDIPQIANRKKKFKTGNNKGYPLKAKDYKIVNAEFDRRHKQRCTVVNIQFNKTSFH